MSRPFLVLADLDGTLIPHLYTSRLDLSGRLRFSRRIVELCRNPRFGVLTGRRHEGFARLFSDLGIDLKYPAYLGLEFGSITLAAGKEMHVWPVNIALAELAQRLSTAVEKVATLNASRDVEQELQRGFLSTYCIEPKRVIMQIEAQYADLERRQQFWDCIAEVLNPFLREHNGKFYLQNYHGRVDVIEHGFFPKEVRLDEVAFALPDCWKQERWKESTLVLLGDEQYDEFLFANVRARYRDRFTEIMTVAVGKELPNRTHYVNNPDEAHEFLVSILSNT